MQSILASPTSLPKVFTPRITCKPYEYPEAAEFAKSIRDSFWTVDHFNFTKDLKDYRIELTTIERQAITRTLLAISQIEIKVKEFWGDLYKHFPKPEFSIMAAAFADSEARHMETYSHLIELLGLNDEFDKILTVPCIVGRIEYISAAMKHSASTNPRQYMMTLALFSLFIENVSLFSQFAIIKSFAKERNLLRAVDNAVQATQKEELVHALGGTYLINTVKAEAPDWFDDEFYNTIYSSCLKAFKAEMGIIDWIFEAGELPFLSRGTLMAFLKGRFNESVQWIGGNPVFDNVGDINGLKWFQEEISAAVNVDFFAKKSPNYSRAVADAESLF